MWPIEEARYPRATITLTWRIGAERIAQTDHKRGGEDMSAQNKALVRRWINAAYNKGDWKVLDEVLASNYVRYDQASGITGKGPDVEKQVATLYRTAFPDLKIKIEELIAEGNTVALRWTATGTA